MMLRDLPPELGVTYLSVRKPSTSLDAFELVRETSPFADCTKGVVIIADDNKLGQEWVCQNWYKVAIPSLLGDTMFVHFPRFGVWHEWLIENWSILLDRTDLLAVMSHNTYTEYADRTPAAPASLVTTRLDIYTRDEADAVTVSLALLDKANTIMLNRHKLWGGPYTLINF